MKPNNKPSNACFSSGPCAKRPGWSIDALKNAALGRSHRSKLGKQKLKETLDLSREILGLPSDYLIGIVPGSDTGAVEMALWSMLGPKPVDVLAWESFGSGWLSDIVKELKIKDVRKFETAYGEIPDFSQVDTKTRDIVFTWNGTTSGVKTPGGNWISDDRDGIVICDATSAVFAMDLPWKKLDVVTYSWQKVLGGEAAHGVIILSPRAVERLKTYTPAWPLPKLFRMSKGGKLIDGIFVGETINTPSMICVEDAIDSLKWAKSVGGLKGLVERSNNNLKAIEEWVKNTPWIDFLATKPETRSNTSICLKVVDPWYQALSAEDQTEKAKALTSLLEKEGVAFDIGAYRDAPPGIRIWGGATVETSDIKILTQWLDWAFGEVKTQAKAA